MVDWGLLRTPDFSQALLGGMEAGRQAGQRQRLDAALSGFDMSRPETAIAVLREDPQTGAALLSASQKAAQAQREADSQAALSNFLVSRFKGAKGGGQASGVSQGAGTPAAPAGASPVAGAPQGAATDAIGDIVVTAPQEDPELALIRSNPQAYLEMQGNLEKLDKSQRQRVSDAAEAQATVAMTAQKLPYEQRRAYIMAQMPYLSSHGVTPQMVQSFDPTDDNIHSQLNQALGVQGALERADKDRAAKLQQDKFDHDVSQDAATLAVSRGNLAVSQGHLALDRQKEGREAKKDQWEATNTIASPTSKGAYDALPSGSRYRAPDGSLRIKK